MTPTLERNWFKKMIVVPALAALTLILRSAWDIKRACAPTCTIPISPSISLRGTSAATESTQIKSTADDRTSVSTTSSAISPVSGWHTITSSTFNPSLWLYSGSNACSASIIATVPPSFCISAIACSASVVFPDDSGPYISTILPRGNPPPSAMSSVIAPLGNVATFAFPASPRRMIAPAPKLLSISSSTRASAFFFASALPSPFIAFASSLRVLPLRAARARTAWRCVEIARRRSSPRVVVVVVVVASVAGVVRIAPRIVSASCVGARARRTSVRRSMHSRRRVMARSSDD